MKEKLKTYSFWVGLVASVMLVVKFVAENFGFKIDEDLVNNVVNSILGILTIFGVINAPSSSTNNTKQDNLNMESDIQDKNNNEEDDNDTKN